MATSLCKEFGKFRIENNVFVSATEEINASELQECVIKLVTSRNLPFGTVFYLIGGIHHGKNDGKVIEGQTDFTLLQGFFHQVYTHLIELKEWDGNQHDYVLIPVTCKSTPNDETFESDYELSNISKRVLKRLANELRTSKKPSLVIFASCYSYESNIKDYLCSLGVMASLNISQDKGFVTQGKAFSLDEDQQNVIKDFSEVK